MVFDLYSINSYTDKLSFPNQVQSELATFGSAARSGDTYGHAA